MRSRAQFSCVRMASKLLRPTVMALPKTLLVPVDFGEASDRAVDYAIDLARACSATVIVAHVYKVPVIGFPDAPILASQEIANRIRSSAEAGLCSLIDRFSGRGVELSGLLEEEEAHAGILAVAEKMHADLIVMGTHGRKGVPRALLGSVAEKVVRTSPCPVLTVHAVEATA